MQTTISGTKALEADVIRQTTTDANGNPVTNLYGTEYLIKYNFQKDYSYSFKFTLEAGTGASVTGFPSLYFGLTNSTSQSSDCGGPEMPVNITGDNASVSSSIPIPAFAGTTTMNVVTAPVSFNSLPSAYLFLNIATSLSGFGNDGTCQVYIKNLTITATAPQPACTLPAPTGLTTTNNTQTLNWTAETNAISYNLSITDTHNGVPTTTTATTTTNSYNFCAQGLGDNVSFTVQGVCSGGIGTVSAPFVFTAASPVPQGLLYDATLNQLSWTSVPGATSYTIQLTDITAGTPTVTYSSAISAISAGGLNLISEHSYQAAVNATAGCYTGAYCSAISFAAPCLYSIVGTTEQMGNFSPVWVFYTQVNTASSYSIRFTNTSTGIATIQPNLPFIESGYQFTIGPGTYQVAVQTVNALCTSDWQTYANNVTVTGTPPPACSPAPHFSAVETAGTSIKIFYANTGATSYNFKFVNLTTNTTQVISNIPYASTGFTYTGIAGDVYQVYIESNCAAGNSGWVQYGSNVTASVNRNLVVGDSMAIMGQDNPVEDFGRFRIFPVPSKGGLNIIHKADEAGNGYITVINMLGTTLMIKPVGIAAGQNTWSLDVSNLPDGVYIVKLFNGKAVYQQKLLVQK